MNRHSPISASPLLTGFIMLFTLSGNPLQAQEQTATARLTLEGANGEDHCTLDFKNGKYDFEGDRPCESDVAIGVELEHAPSASNILLFDDYTCDRNDDGNYFWIYLRTVKEDVTTVKPIDLDQIMTMPRGAVIVPGVRVMDYYQKPGETAKERTSCVHIEVDAPPMTPLTRDNP